MIGTLVLAFVAAASAPVVAVQEPAVKAASAIDPDALCLVMARTAALSSRTASPDVMSQIEGAFAYFAGRLRARHAAGEITPLVAAALKFDAPKDQYDLKGLGCLAYGEAAARGEPADDDSAAKRGELPDSSPDPAAQCVVLLRQRLTSSQTGTVPDRPQPAVLRGLRIGTAFYSGQVTGRYGARAFRTAVERAGRSLPPSDQIDALTTSCFRDGSRGMRDVNLEIDAALPSPSK